MEFLPLSYSSPILTLPYIHIIYRMATSIWFRIFYLPASDIKAQTLEYIFHLLFYMCFEILYLSLRKEPGSNVFWKQNGEENIWTKGSKKKTWIKSVLRTKLRRKYLDLWEEITDRGHLWTQKWTAESPSFNRI